MCMICKNEEQRIGRCLESLMDTGLELVVVDTGSTDRTKEIALQYTSCVYDYTWCNDFSDARNYSLQMASNDWILMLDADEWIEQIDIEELLYFKKNLSDAVGSVSRHNKVGTPENPGYTTDRTERFFNRKKYHYTGTIHEQLTPKYRLPMDCYLLKTEIGHDGYCMSDAEREQKAHRNISLLEDQLRSDPGNPYVLYQLGKGYEMIQDITAAAEYYAKALSFPLDFSLAYVQALLVSYGNTLLQLGENHKALDLLQSYPPIRDIADYSYLAGRIYQANGRTSEAVQAFQNALRIPLANQEGVNSHLARKELEELLAKDCHCPFTICFIAKNEEKNMDTFLSSILKYTEGYSPEILMADTGSTDRTVEIAQKYGVRILHFNWIKDFSAARNFLLEHASHDFVLVLDCDEFLTELSIPTLCRFMQEHPCDIGMLTRRNHYEMNGTDSVYTDQVERFFNRRYYHYEGAVHEQVRPIGDSAAGQIQRIGLPICVEHTGYMGTPEEMQQKADRNNELLLKMLAETPDDPYLYFQLGQSYNFLHNDEKACYYYGKGLEYDIDPKWEYAQMMVIGYGYALLHLNRLEEALAYEAIYDDFSFSADFVCLMGVIYMRNGMILKAMNEFLKATTYPTSSVEGANSFIPNFNMGCINEAMGHTSDAISYYRKCGSFAPALERLKELEGS